MFCLKRVGKVSFISGRSLLYLSASRGFHESSMWNDPRAASNLNYYPRFLDDNSCYRASKVDQVAAAAKFKRATAIQSAMIPISLSKPKDLLVRAKTGSGKTTGSLISMVTLLNYYPDTLRSKNFVVPSGIIILPTLELCQQTADILNPFLKVMWLDFDVVVLKPSSDMDRWPKCFFIVISTPDCLLSCLKSQSLQTESPRQKLDLVIIDEADQLLSNGYKDAIKSILAYAPKSCSCHVISSNLSADVEQLKRLCIRNPDIVTLPEGSLNVEISPFNVELLYESCERFEKLIHFVSCIKILGDKYVIFCNSVHMSRKLKLYVEKHVLGLKAEVVDRGLPEDSRLRILEDFNAGRIEKLIISTSKKSLDWVSSVLSGINFDNVDAVINFGMPRTVDEYVARVDRSGRTQTAGKVLFLASFEEMDILDEIQCSLGNENSKIAYLNSKITLKERTSS